MPSAFRAWRELEADAGEALYIRTGGVSFSPPGVDYAARVAASLAELDVPHWYGTGREFRQRQPVFALPDDDDVVFEPDAGLLAASRAVAVQVELARRHRRRRDVGPRPDPGPSDRPGWRQARGGDRLDADRRRSAGRGGRRVGQAAAADLPVPVRVTRQQVLYFRPADAARFQIGRFPVFIYKGAGEDEAFYGMPDFLGLGVKAARHAGPEVDPDIPDPAIGEDYRSIVRQFLRGHIPTLADAAIGFTEVCLYTVAPDDDILRGLPAAPPRCRSSPARAADTDSSSRA